MKTKRYKRAGFTLVEIMIVVAIIGLLASIAIPNYVHARGRSQANACINNMHQIDGGIQLWALEHGRTSSDPVTAADIKPYIKLNSALKMPGCPANGTSADGESDYKTDKVGSVPAVTCSIGAGLSPAHALP
jgi:prepilin-type N-terminal cleavage/methylation domain-containing protein